MLAVRKASKVKGSKTYMGKIITLNEYSAYRFVEFPEFSRQEVCNPLMFDDNFGSFDWTLISLRSLALALTLFPPLAGL